MKKRRGLWVVYRVCAVAVVTAMAWLTSDLLALERAQDDSRANALHQENLRLALWRMDSWLAPRLVIETSIAPSPSNHAAFIRQRLDVGPGWRAPLSLASLETYAKARETLTAGQSDANDIDGNGGTRIIDVDRNELSQRSDLNTQAQNGVRVASRHVFSTLDHIEITSGFEQPAGPLLPLWIRSASGESRLVFLRRVFEPNPDPKSVPGTLADAGKMQLFIADWPALQALLLAQIRDRLPQAKLRPRDPLGDAVADTGLVLASAPIVLDAPRPETLLPLWTPTRITLAIAWIAIAGSLVAVGVALKRTVDLSERRSRFASSVTHELRTPLTTFRLYSEMLADGMVTDAAQQQVYLDTLKSESSRLAMLVENVLAYARVEEGRMPVRRERIAVADLLLRVTPPLDRRAKDAGRSLVVETGDAASRVVDVDPEVVGQILFNLVDNACKYSPDGDVALTASSRAGVTRLIVRDHGPGIKAHRVRAAFTPFERAGRPAGDVIPGIGLGLALSRALARDLGGDLDYEPAPGGGACFVLTLPTPPMRA